MRFALETALDELGRRRGEFLDRLEHLAKVTADADPADVEAAGKCALCVAKTTMHDDDGGVVFAGRQRAKPASNRERNLREIDARSGGRSDAVSALRRVAAVQAIRGRPLRAPRHGRGDDGGRAREDRAG